MDNSIKKDNGQLVFGQTAAPEKVPDQEPERVFDKPAEARETKAESLKDVMKRAAALVEKELERYLGPEYAGSNETTEAMKYSVLGGGKRVRAFLVLEFCRLFGGSEDAALPFACALECIHASSLIHDDMPCMDDDVLRRGKPSCHVKYGEAGALLAGDALLTFAFELCASNRYVSHKAVRYAVATLAHEAGVMGMMEGQTLDLKNAAESYSDLKKIFLRKTSCLIKAACLLGYFAAVESPSSRDTENIKKYADAIGLAFQIHDDILDVKGDTATLGKTAGTDEKNDRKTVLSFMSMSEAEDEETLLTLLAVEVISGYENSKNLCDLAVWLLSRKK